MPEKSSLLMVILPDSVGDYANSEMRTFISFFGNFKLTQAGYKPHEGNIRVITQT